MKKRILLSVLILILTLALLPAAFPSEAASAVYPLWVGGTQVTDLNKSNIPVAGGSAHYDPSTGTLTLEQVTGVSGLHTSSDSGCMICAEGIDLTIKGSAVLTNTTADYGILVSGGALTIRAELTLSCKTCAVRADDLLLSGCSIVSPSNARIYAGRIYGGGSTPAASVRIALTLPVITVQPSSVEAMAGQEVSFRVAASGVGLQYQWQTSTDSGKTWANRSGATQNVLRFTAGDGDLGVRVRCVVSNSAGSVASAAAVLSPLVPVPPTILTQPKDASAKLGVTTSFRVEASGSDLHYQWQFSKNNGAAWYAWSGKTEAVLPVKASATNSGCLYRCKVTGCSGTVLTDSARLTVPDAPPLILVQPVGASVTEGGTAVFRVTCAGAQLSYQWQSSTNGGTSWTNLAGKVSASLPLIGSTAGSGTLYRCMVTNPFGSTVSAAAALQVKAKPGMPSITQQPADVTASLGQTVTFRVSASGTELSYQWYYSKTGGASWALWSGKTAASLSVKASTTNNNCLYRCEVSNSAGSVVSAAACLTVENAGLTILSQPQDASALIGNQVTFTVSVQGNGLNYQWYYSKNNGTSWTKWSGKTAASFSVKASTTNNGCLYRCLVTGAGGSATSRAARLTATNCWPTILTQPQNASAAFGQTVTFHVTVWGTGLKYQWYYSKNNGANWTAWSGKTSPDLTVTASSTNNGCLYRCYIYNVYGVATTEKAKLTVS